jgi:hypothetical protein
MSRALIAATLLACAAGGAHATGSRHQDAHFDIAYYQTHPTFRADVLRLCQQTSPRGDLPDCRNASKADAEVRSSGVRASDIMTPQWFRDNPIARDGIIAQCARRGPGDELVLPFCTAALQGKR